MARPNRSADNKLARIEAKNRRNPKREEAGYTKSHD
jgi:hypothetical protein